MYIYLIKQTTHVTSIHFPRRVRQINCFTWDILLLPTTAHVQRKPRSPVSSLDSSSKRSPQSPRVQIPSCCSRRKLPVFTSFLFHLLSFFFPLSSLFFLVIKATRYLKKNHPLLSFLCKFIFKTEWDPLFAPYVNMCVYMIQCTIHACMHKSAGMCLSL